MSGKSPGWRSGPLHGDLGLALQRTGGSRGGTRYRSSRPGECWSAGSEAIIAREFMVAV
jgi:hypothetical protein